VGQPDLAVRGDLVVGVSHLRLADRRVVPSGLTRAPHSLKGAGPASKSVRSMHVVFVEPRFPANQKQFVRGLAEVGATVTAIGEGSKESLDDELKRWLTHYEEVRNVTDAGQVLEALKFIQSKKHVDRIEA